MIPLYISDDAPLESQYKDAADEWNRIKLRGNDTGCWTDGMCMNLLRNKMRTIKFRMKGKMSEEYISSLELPDKVSYEYCHRESWKKKGRKKNGK